MGAPLALDTARAISLASPGCDIERRGRDHVSRAAAMPMVTLLTVYRARAQEASPGIKRICKWKGDAGEGGKSRSSALRVLRNNRHERRKDYFYRHADGALNSHRLWSIIVVEDFRKKLGGRSFINVLILPRPPPPYLSSPDVYIDSHPF